VASFISKIKFSLLFINRVNLFVSSDSEFSRFPSRGLSYYDRFPSNSYYCIRPP
jgi:hypothetical protein